MSPVRNPLALAMGRFNNILDTISIPYVDTQTLLGALKNYKKPRDWIARQVKNGALIRLRNGLFLISSRFKQGQTHYPYEQLANLIYGPSYVSLEWALSFYGFIPERVMTITSITTGKNKTFHTPIGCFTYAHLSKSSYACGITHCQRQGELGGFLLATAEKALADLVFFTCPVLQESEMLKELTESKRIPIEMLKTLHKKTMQEIALHYHSKKVHTLTNLLFLL